MSIDVDNNVTEPIRTGLSELGDGIAWCGFWLCVGLVVAGFMIASVLLRT